MTGLLVTLAIGAANQNSIGVNVVLNTVPTPAILADLGEHGQVLDVMPQIKAVTLRASEPEIPSIRMESYVTAADKDGCVHSAGIDSTTYADFSNGANHWSLDAIDVTDFGGTRTVGYTGHGVYIAVIDSGLPFNWRAVVPESQIATEHARAFAGGGGDVGTVTSSPLVWEHDQRLHGMAIVSVLLGFRYLFQEPALAPEFNGVAPGAKVIPIMYGSPGRSLAWYSAIARCITYVADLKTSGALGSSPVVINASWGDFENPPIMRAAIDFALARGVIIVAAANNHGDAGMTFPGSYAPVISAAASGWVRQFPADDPTLFAWPFRDVPESDASAHAILPFSSRELPGQDLDIAAPGAFVPCVFNSPGRVDYSFFSGTSAATPHVAGVVALMLEKNPNLTGAQIEAILENTALPLPPGTATGRSLFVQSNSAVIPTLGNQFANALIFEGSISWGANAAGAGVLDADAALAATPLP